MKATIILATLAIVVAIVVGPIVTDWLTAPDPIDQLIEETLYGREARLPR